MRKKMRDKLFCFVLALALAFSFVGCEKLNPETAENSGTAGAEGTGLAGEDLFLSLENLPWRDNSLDAYSAVLNVPLRRTEPEGIAGGTYGYILGNARASIFSRYIFFEAADSWDEMKTVTDQGGEASFRLAFPDEQIYNFWAGGIAGSDHYAIMGTERDDSQGFLYRFFETDESMQVLSSFYVDGLDKSDYEFTRQLRVDARGNLHVITQRDSDDTYHYYVVAPGGTLLTEVGPGERFKEQAPTLFFLSDGRVGMQFEEQLQCVNAETGKTEVLAKVKENTLYCTLWDEKALLYADGMGLYRSGLSGENPEILYTWSNHGVSVSKIIAMQVTEGGEISLIYMDYKGANYLKLEPTTEEVEIQEITFAVSSSSSQRYQAMVAAFNKKYPAYHIRMKTYALNEPRLLTELMAGGGPVLVDTVLTGFENNTELWEPLDEAFRQMQLEGELIPQVLEVGKINGTLYGVSTDFSLNTVVTFAEEPDEWDYDAFLSCFDENDPSVKSVYNSLNGSDGWPFIATFFLHGLEEKYLFDAENCTTRFDSGEFRKILRLTRSFMKKERQGNLEDLWQGTSPCAVVLIQNPDALAYLRIWGGGKLRFIGYPSGEGSRHYITATTNPITIRVNATAEEKRLAHSFLQFLLSYDAQMEAVLATSINYQMSVRWDVLEEQINCVNEDSWPCLVGFPQFGALGDQVDNELDKATLYGLLEKAEPERGMPRELVNIYLDELNDYLSGDVTEDVLIEHLENRVGLYLMEQK